VVTLAVKYLSGAQLIERWSLDDDEEAAREAREAGVETPGERFLRHLRETHRIEVFKPSPKKVRYPIEEIERLEKDGLTKAMSDGQATAATPKEKREKPSKPPKHRGSKAKR
jgi:hypothetical protein